MDECLSVGFVELLKLADYDSIARCSTYTLIEALHLVSDHCSFEARNGFSISTWVD
jgi:hypothetical protein